MHSQHVISDLLVSQTIARPTPLGREMLAYRTDFGSRGNLRTLLADCASSNTGSLARVLCESHRKRRSEHEKRMKREGALRLVQARRSGRGSGGSGQPAGVSGQASI